MNMEHRATQAAIGISRHAGGRRRPGSSWRAATSPRRTTCSASGAGRCFLRRTCSRTQCGWPWFLRAEARATRLYATDPAARRVMSADFAVPLNAFQYGGYGLFMAMK